MFALALLLKAGIRDLASYDYVPPASPVWEPVNIAASQSSYPMVSFLLSIYLLFFRKWKEGLPCDHTEEKDDDFIFSFISMSYINNILVAVFAEQFFGPKTAALAAFYNIPYYVGIFFIKMMRRHRQ